MAVLLLFGLLAVSAAASVQHRDHLPSNILERLYSEKSLVSQHPAYILMRQKLNMTAGVDYQTSRQAITPHIIGGTPASANKWPWQLSLQLYVDFLGGWIHFCGAVLIRKDVALTAAHCIAGLFGYYPYRVQAGSVVLGDSNSQYINVSDGIMHPDYGSGPGMYPNDIATLKLLTPAVLDQSVQAVEIADKKDKFDSKKHECWITGWGRIEDYQYPTQLMEVSIPPIDQDTCNCNWLIASEDAINDGHICVYEPGKASCSGDSGGPLVCKKKGKGHGHGPGPRHRPGHGHGNRRDEWTLAGLTSWGLSSCGGYLPSVYTRVSHFSKWIKENLH